MFHFFYVQKLDAPSCSPNQPRIYGVAKQEQAQIRCNVDANPPDVEFKWTFNNSAESIDVASNHVTRSGKNVFHIYTLYYVLCTYNLVSIVGLYAFWAFDQILLIVSCTVHTIHSFLPAVPVWVCGYVLYMWCFFFISCRRYTFFVVWVFVVDFVWIVGIRLCIF